jgi:protein O-mannosyl-transferase
MEGRRRRVLAHHEVQLLRLNPGVTQDLAIHGFQRRTWLSALSLALLAIASSAAGILNEFTYDDRPVILDNPFMHDLRGVWRVFTQSYWPQDWGGDGYRPLTSLAFKLEFALSGGSSAVVHGVNIALYALAAVLAFYLARRMMPDWCAWVVAALFAVHPVHVEAVANGVGQSELLVAVFMLPAVTLYLRDRMRMDGVLAPRTVAAIMLLYVASCFSKEHGVVLPALLVAAELTLIEDAQSVGARVRRLRPFYLGLTAIALAFLAARSRVFAGQGIVGFQPFQPFASLHISPTDRILTAIGVVPDWFRLLYWPAHLSSEYSPPDTEIAQGLSVSQLPGFVLLIAIVALGIMLRRKRPVVSFGIAFAAITLLPSSNFLVTTGIVIAERTLFLPSLGAMIVLGGLLVPAMAAWRARFAARTVWAPQLLCGVVLLTGAARSERRTTVWHDNDRLFRQATVDAPMSYRSHYMYGSWLFQHRHIIAGEVQYKIALKLFPYDPYMAFNLAERYREFLMCPHAIPQYQWVLALDPEFPLGRTQLASCLLDVGRYDAAKAAALDALKAGGPSRITHHIILVADSLKAAAHSAAKKNDTTRAVAVARKQIPDGKLPETLQKAAEKGGTP